MRTIYAPNREEKNRLRQILSELTKKAAKLCPDGVAHGFMFRRSAVTNATAHIGHKYTTVFDLQDFFDSVKIHQLRGKIKEEYLPLVLVDGAARQGLPTSPACANIAASDMDKAILKWRDANASKIQFVYTRYADDMTFSYDDPETKPFLLQEIPKIIGRCGFKVNKDKTRTYAEPFRVVTGVHVYEDRIAPLRKCKRNLRAALHQGNKNEANGLAEWCKLKVPSERSKDSTKDEIESLTSLWKIRKINLDRVPKKLPDEDLGDNVVITGDPAYMLGMSTFTTGWTSCMSQPNGAYRKGVVTWLCLEGTRIAAFLSDKTKKFGNCERRVMRARALVHQLRDGRKVYDRIYGNPEDQNILRGKLKEAGFLDIHNPTVRGQTVVGNVKMGNKPYCDNLHNSKVALKGSRKTAWIFKT